jgi:hypothetical protein
MGQIPEVVHLAALVVLFVGKMVEEWVEEVQGII